LWGDWRVGGYAGYLKLLEEAVGFVAEPGWVARLQGDRGGVEVAEHGEEVAGAKFVEGEAGWELEEDRAQLPA